MKFNTEEEAQAELEKLKVKDPDWFCPLIGRYCNPECILFLKASIDTYHDGDEQYYRIIKADCGKFRRYNRFV